MKQISYEKALHQLAVYCSKGEKCSYDIKKKMDKWELSEKEQSRILKQLQEDKFIDEERYAKAFVHDKSHYSKWGSYKIKYELRKRNIPDAIIAIALLEINPDENREQLSFLLKNKIKSIKGKSDFERKQKLFRFALGRGYSPEDIEGAISSLF